MPHSRAISACLVGPCCSLFSLAARCVRMLAAMVIGVAVHTFSARAQSRAPAPPLPEGITRSRVVELSTLEAARTGRIELKLRFTIGGLEENGDIELDSSQPLLSAVRLSDGTIVVNEFTQLKFIDPASKRIRTSGRSGRGPGEFVQIRELCRLHGDSLVAVDFSTGELSVWDDRGRYVRSLPRRGSVVRGGCRADGLLLFERDIAITGRAGPRTSTREYYTIDLDGVRENHVASLSVARFSGPISFEPSVLPYGDSFLIADPLRGELQLLDAGGRVERLVRLSTVPSAPSVAEYRRRVLAFLPVGSSAEMVARFEAQRPASMPAFGPVKVDSDGRIWIQNADERRVWTIISRDGHVLDRVELPQGDLVSFTADLAVIRSRDVEGVARLHFFEIVFRGR